MALPAAHAWSHQHLGDRLIAVIDPSLEVLLRRTDLPIEIWVVSKKDRGNLVKLLRENSVDSALIMTNSVGSLWPYFKARIPLRIGFGGKWTRWLLNSRADRSLLNLPQGERWLRILGVNSNCPPTPYLIHSVRDIQVRPQLLVFPGAKYGPAKQWDMKSYAHLISLCQKKGWEIYLMGTPAEKKDALEIEKYLTQPVKNLCGTLSLSALLDYISLLPRPLVLANDSGAMHLLAACGVPTVGLYFSTSASNTPPAFGPYKICEAEVSCRPCYARTCPLGHYQCRSALNPARVAEILEGFLIEQV